MATFRLNPAPTFPATVHLTVPGAEELAPIDLTFRHRGAKDLDALARRAAEARESGESFNDLEFLAEVVVGWRGVKGGDDQEVPFSRDALGQLLDAYPASGREIAFAYGRAMRESKAKN